MAEGQETKGNEVNTQEIMNTETHTPGPWIATSRDLSDGSLVVKADQLSEDFREICSIREREHRTYGPQDEIDKANAALIASAPDMAAELATLRAENLTLKVEASARWAVNSELRDALEYLEACVRSASDIPDRFQNEPCMLQARTLISKHSKT